MIFEAIKRILFAPVSIINIVIFRILFGIVIFIEAIKAIATGWIEETFLSSDFSFTLIGFEFLLLLKNDWMYVHYIIIALSGLFIAAGLYYRYSLSVFLAFWFVAYAMQKQHYNNHYYLYILLGFLLILIPADKELSLDTKLKRTSKLSYCSAWCMYIIILQLFIVYFYAATAKIYPEWLAGKPLTIWLGHKTYLKPVLQTQWFIPFLAYGGIIYDLFIIPLLLVKKTRIGAIILSLFFHLFNSIIFRIGTFPFMMLGTIILFIPAQKIENLHGKYLNKDAKIANPHFTPALAILLSVFFTLQILLPLRHFLYPGDVNWTEEGYRLSWRMMLRSKESNINFKVVDKSTNSIVYIDPVNEGLIEQQKNAMGKFPDMIWQYAQYLKKRLAKRGLNNVAIYCNAQVRLNGEPFKYIIDPKTDLTSVKWESFQTSEWVLKY